MTLAELMKESDQSLDEMVKYFASVGNTRALGAISLVREYRNATVRVVKGRKVPIGTVGNIFWLGSYCHSPYGDPWGIYTTYRCGLRDENGNVHWTSLNNVEVIEREG